MLFFGETFLSFAAAGGLPFGEDKSAPVGGSATAATAGDTIGVATSGVVTYVDSVVATGRGGKGGGGGGGADDDGADPG